MKYYRALLALLVGALIALASPAGASVSGRRNTAIGATALSLYELARGKTGTGLLAGAGGPELDPDLGLGFQSGLLHLLDQPEQAVRGDGDETATRRKEKARSFGSFSDGAMLVFSRGRATQFSDKDLHENAKERKREDPTKITTETQRLTKRKR